MRGGGKFPFDIWAISSSTIYPGGGARTLATSGAQPGEQVLEISTGYHTALLTHRPSARHVLSVEVATRPARPRVSVDEVVWDDQPVGTPVTPVHPVEAAGDGQT